MIKIVYHWIRKIAAKRSRSFWIAFTLLIITALGMRPSSSCLLTATTPLAIVDLELAFNQATANSIKELWTSHQCSGTLSISSNAMEAAIINIILDFAFIVSYTWFFVVLVVLTRANDSLAMDKVTLLGCYATLAAGLLDVIENIFMLIFLIVGEINSLLFAAPATIKFVTIALLSTFIVMRLFVRIFKSRAS